MNGARVLGKRAPAKRRVTSMPAGLAVMAAIEIIEWPLAVVMMVGHEISHRTPSPALRELAEGVEAGA